jgi:hypothetical protein
LAGIRAPLAAPAGTAFNHLSFANGVDAMTRWAIVLAAGEGSRLRLLTTDDRGVVTPKQFCSLRGGASLLERTLART